MVSSECQLRRTLHGTGLTRSTQPELDNVAAELNDRPRQTVDFMKPFEKVSELLAMTG